MNPSPRRLRDYQAEAVRAVEADWTAGINRTAVVLPTGAGKSTVIAALAVRAYRRGTPVALLAHRAELLDQMCTAVLQVDLDIPLEHVGIVRGRQNQAHAPIVAATLQTLSNKNRLYALGPRPVVLLDEAHHGAATGYYRTLGDLGVFTGGRLCGFTATMNRDEKSSIGLGDLFQNIAFERDLTWAIDEGYLCRPRGLTVHTGQLDALSSVRTIAGDYDKKQLGEIMEAAADCVTHAVLNYARDRRSIIFAATVAAAENMAAMLTEQGHPTGVITGSMSYEARRPAYEAFRDGRLRALTTVGVLTEGADFPMCDCVVLARPTKSTNLYSQMVGRALRLWPGKTDALVLDLTGQGQQVVCLTDLAAGVETVDVDESGREHRPTGGVRPREEPKRTGAVTVREFELLPRAAAKYDRTDGGYLFVDTYHDRIALFLVKVADGWRVGRVNTSNGRWRLADQALPFDQADKVVKTLAEMEFGGLRPRSRNTDRASDRQVAFALRLGIVDAETMTVAELGRRISAALVGRVLDESLPAVLDNDNVSKVVA